MRVGDSVRLDRPPRVIGDAHALIVGMAAGKRVLNVGAAGNARHYSENGTEGWLHKRLADRAARLVGLDIDEAEIAVARNIGFDIIAGDCETIALGETFDLIILSDVIEHVANPGTALVNVARHLGTGGRIVITTPNATFAGSFLKVLCRLPPNVYWDHVALYAPEHIQALCDRHGFQLRVTAFFTLPDRRTPSVLIASAIIATLARVWPRFHASFLCIISAEYLGCSTQ